MTQEPIAQNQVDSIQELVSHELEEGFAALAAVMAHVIIEEDSGQNALLPKKVQKEILAQTLTTELIGLKRRLESGAKCFMKTLEVLSKEHPEINLENVAADFEKLTQYCSTFEENVEEFETAVEEGKSIQELAGMSWATIEALDLAAKRLYDEKRYADAADCFCILTILKPQEITFWLGFGNAEYFSQHYEAALMAYALAVHANPDDPAPHLYSSKCYEELKQIDNAINALDLALYVIRDEKNRDQLKTWIERETKRLTTMR